MECEFYAVTDARAFFSLMKVGSYFFFKGSACPSRLMLIVNW